MLDFHGFSGKPLQHIETLCQQACRASRMTDQLVVLEAEGCLFALQNHICAWCHCVTAAGHSLGVETPHVDLAIAGTSPSLAGRANRSCIMQGQGKTRNE